MQKGAIAVHAQVCSSESTEPAQPSTIYLTLTNNQLDPIISTIIIIIKRTHNRPGSRTSTSLTVQLYNFKTTPILELLYI